MSSDRLIIFDTTLRDGEQSPGASMNLPEKLEIAHALKDLGVDVIEAGFPIASPGDFEAVQKIAHEVHGPVIAGLARCNPADIDRAWEALKGSPNPRIHVFLATSAIHREYKLRMTPEEIVERAGNCALEEIVMAVKTRPDYFQLQTGINTRLLYPTSRKLCRVTGMVVQRNKAIVGQNAFAHEAGIHQDGMLKHHATYEIMRPEDVGLPRTELVLGKHSGRHALRDRVNE